MGEEIDYLPDKIPSQKKRLSLCSVLIIFLSLVTAVGFAYQNFQLKKQNYQLRQKNTQPTRAPIPTTYPLSSLKTYYNTQFFYQFNYPDEYTVKESENLPEDILQQVVVENSTTNPNNHKYITVSVKKAVKLDDEVAYQKHSIEGHILVYLAKETKTAKDGLDGVQLYYLPMNESENLRPFTILVLGYKDISFITRTVNDYYSYVIQSNIDQLIYGDKYPTQADQIFLNFKQLSRPPVVQNAKVDLFSVSSNDSVNQDGWKTYVDQSLGFTIKYPTDWSVNIRQDNDYYDDIPTFTLQGPTRWITSAGGIHYPELNIGSMYIYSTSGALLANESSAPKIGTLNAKINGNSYSTPIHRVSTIYTNSKVAFFDGYRLDFVKLSSLRSKPWITAEFGTAEQGQTIADILSTITF